MDRNSWALICATAALAVTGAGPCSLAATEVWQTAPPLIVRELDGQSFDLAAQRGKVVIVNFWATWCRPCREEMPALDAFYRRYHGQGLELIGLSADRPHDRSDVGKMMQSFSYPAAMLDDAKVNDFDTPAVLPVTFVVDRDGVVRVGRHQSDRPLYERPDALRRVQPGSLDL